MVFSKKNSDETGCLVIDLAKGDIGSNKLHINRAENFQLTRATYIIYNGFAPDIAKQLANICSNEGSVLPVIIKNIENNTVVYPSAITVGTIDLSTIDSIPSDQSDANAIHCFIGDIVSVDIVFLSDIIPL